MRCLLSVCVCVYVCMYVYVKRITPLWTNLNFQGQRSKDHVIRFSTLPRGEELQKRRTNFDVFAPALSFIVPVVTLCAKLE